MMRSLFVTRLFETEIHDKLDLAPMKVRVGGGLADHNGLRSINAAFGPDFRRMQD